VKLSMLVVLNAFLLWSPASQAVELHEIDVDRGTENLERVPIEIHNTGSATLACTAELAHWYSEAVATVAAGSAATVDLWFAPQTGTFALLNQSEDNMPVEALWCGIAGRAYETRTALRLDPRSAVPRRIDCAAAGDRVVCE